MRTGRAKLQTGAPYWFPALNAASCVIPAQDLGGIGAPQIGWREGGHRVGGEGLGGFASNKDAQVSYMHNTAPGVGSRRSLGKDTVQWRDVISKKSQEQQGCKSLFYPCCWRTRAVSSGPCALGLADGGSSR